MSSSVARHSPSCPSSSKPKALYVDRLLRVNVSMSVRTSTKRLSDLTEIWCVVRGRWVIHDGMLYNPIQGQGQGHGGLKCATMADFKRYQISSASIHVIKRLMVNCDTPRQYVNFNGTDLWYSSSFSVTWPSNSGCSTFGERILRTRNRPAVPCTGIIYYFNNYCTVWADSRHRQNLLLI